jgi:hypothetical protein
MFKHFFLKMFLLFAIGIFLIFWFVVGKSAILQHYSWMRP